MALTLFISPHGRACVESRPDESDRAPDTAALNPAIAERIVAAFAHGDSAGLVHLATTELRTPLPPPFAYARDFAREYLTRLCHIQSVDQSDLQPLPPPPPTELAFMVLRAPPMRGLEYLNASVLENWWTSLDEHVRREISAYPGGAAEYLRDKNPLWRLVGRVTFHLAENKRDPTHPFAFMASYASRLSEQGRLQHLALSRALQEYAGAKNRAALVALLTPISQAADRLGWVKELVDSGDVYQALAWTPPQAYALLRDLPELERSGLVVRVPDWWKQNRNSRPQVSVKIGQAAKSRLGMDELVDFHVGVAIGNRELSAEELRELMASPDNLVRFQGQWVELDRDKLAVALEHWKRVERQAGSDGISFADGMRLLAGMQLNEHGVDDVPAEVRQWTGVAAGQWLDQTLSELRDPGTVSTAAPAGLKATLRPYQLAGLHWLRFMTRLGLGCCLADDMGLGKTIQVLSLLLHEKNRRDKATSSAAPALLVLPASLIANWQSEIARFAPSLRTFVAHPWETEIDLQDKSSLATAAKQADVVITTYGMLTRLPALQEQQWGLAILDEAQAIKNTGARQTQAAKKIRSTARIALTGTPIENRLSDLWSLFDFLNPGLLGSAKAFGQFVKKIQKQDQPDYAPLRTLAAPYILRRLKTDKHIISDLPDKTEVKAFCNLSPQQAGLYQQSVHQLSDAIATAEGIQRRGLVLAYLMRLKQICNHPSQWTGDGSYDPAHSGKFQRLAELCQELAQRQEKALVFTQFREIADPLASHLATVFNAPGLVLHGSTPLPKRREMVESFQRETGPPFFVLSLKAGGTGLNLTAAAHVIHFDRWWNPAVENQATDRAFRIGQKRNVMVHKFVCRGTVEEKIDALIAEKVALSNQLLDTGGAEKLLTEMNNRELLEFVSLDINKATES